MNILLIILIILALFLCGIVVGKRINKKKVDNTYNLEYPADFDNTNYVLQTWNKSTKKAPSHPSPPPTSDTYK